jgi:cytochrome P450
MALLIAGGTETSSHTLSIMLALIAGHPAVQQRVGEELGRHGLLATPAGPPPRSPTWEDLGGLPYLTAVMNESMRLLPVGAQGTVR